MKPYPQYKDSRVELIGEVPEHWKSAKLKYLADVVLGKMLVNDDKGGMFPKLYLRAANLQWFKADISDVKEMWFSGKEIERLRLKKDDLLMSEGGEVGRTCIWNNELDECYLQNSVHKITFNQKNNAKYHLYQSYVMGQLGYFDSIVNRISIAHLTGEKVKEIYFLTPPLLEQTAIAAFLDLKTAEIDSIIAKKERLIELYEEEKAAVINHAVTKGLDPAAKMKDSGIEWLGEIPEHWEIRKIRYLFEIKKRIVGEIGYDVLSITQKGIKVKDIEKMDGQISSDYSKYQLVKKGDFAMNHMDLLTGYVDISQYDGVTSPDYRVFSLSELNYIDRYFLFLFQIGYKRKIFYAFGQGAAHFGRWRFPTEEFRAFEFPIPPRDEQAAIVQHIETKCSHIDAIISKFKRQIELLKEYRTALISEAVTGKIDVRENMHN